MSSIRKLASDTVIYGFSSILPRILNYLVLNTYLTYKIDTESYGEYKVFYLYAGMISLFLIFRLETAYFRFGSKADDKDTFFSSAYLFHIVLSLVTFITIYMNADSIASQMGFEGKPYLVQWFGVIVAIDCLKTLPLARLRLENKPFQFMFYNLLNVALFTGFILFFLELAPGIPQLRDQIAFEGISQIDYVFFANFLANIALYLSIIPLLTHTVFKFNSTYLKQMLTYSWPLLIVSLGTIMNHNFPTQMQISLLDGTRDQNEAMTAIYNTTLSLAILINLFNTAFNYAAEPFFFNQHAKSSEDRSVYGKVANIYCLAACLIALTMYFSVFILQYLIGKDFRDALNLLPIILMAFVFQGMYYNFSYWYKLTDKTLIGAKITIVSVCITLLINYFGIPIIGYDASGWALFFGYLFTMTAGYVLGQKYFPTKYPIRKILTALGISTTVMVSIYFLNRAGLVNTSTHYLFMGMGMVVYLGITYSQQKELIVQSFGRK